MEILLPKRRQKMSHLVIENTKFSTWKTLTLYIKSIGNKSIRISSKQNLYLLSNS